MYGVTELEKFHVLPGVALLEGLSASARDEFIRDSVKVGKSQRAWHVESLRPGIPPLDGCRLLSLSIAVPFTFAPFSTPRFSQITPAKIAIRYMNSHLCI